MTTDPNTDLRQRIAEAVERLHETGGLYALDAGEPERIADAVLAVLPPPAGRTAVVLSEAERLMLRHALDLADANVSARPDEYTAADEAALTSLRRLADEAQQQREPSVHGESVAALAGYQPDGHDTWAGEQQVVTETPASEDSAERRERYAQAIHDAMETDLSLDDQEPGLQALFARAAEAAVTLADAEQAELRSERDLAIAHDRQPYPTAWAYEQACKALRRKTDVLDRVREYLERHEHRVAVSPIDVLALLAEPAVDARQDGAPS